MNKKLIAKGSYLLFLITLVSLMGCQRESKNIAIIGGSDGPTSIYVTDTTDDSSMEEPMNYSYSIISQEEAKKIMETEESVVILDVREQDEFDEGHIQGAVLIPYTEIENRAHDLLPDIDQKILVYCRSGRRSKIAAEALARMGYTNVWEFGGIIDWPYEIVQ